MSTPVRPSLDQLLAGRQNLKNADESLVDRFIAIRNLNMVFGSPNQQAALSDSDVQRLKSITHRAKPSVRVSYSVGNSRFPPGGTQAEMIFDTTFASQVQGAPPIRVIRFVKAAQVNRNFGKTKSEHTVPGYVHYQSDGEVAAKQPNAPDDIRQKLQNSFALAQWSFDGPREEFRGGGGLTNQDTPGVKYSDLPYAMTAEFLIVLYHETAKRILEVGHSVGSLGVWKRINQTQLDVTFQLSDKLRQAI